MITTQIQTDRQKTHTDRILFRQTAMTDHYSSTTDHYLSTTDHYSPTCMNSFQTDPLQKTDRPVTEKTKEDRRQTKR